MSQDMSLNQVRLRLHAAHTYAMEIRQAADRRWGSKSALSVATREAQARLTTALNVVDDLVNRGER